MSWCFLAAPPGDSQKRYVIQQAVIDAMATGDGPLSMQTQAEVLSRAAAVGVPVAAPIASGAWNDREYLIAEWRHGEALPPKMLRDPDLDQARRRLNADCAQALARIHQIPTEGLEITPQDRVGVYRARLDQIGEPRPVLELGYRWLAANRPPARPDVLVHGDFRLGNLLVGPEGLEAVLDWELAHLGDPHEDVAWATIRAWRFDRHRQPGMFPDPTEWLAAYNLAAGADAALDPNTFRWWQIAGTWVWAVMSALQARRHLDGWMQSLEHAVIGRRVCESEWDLLELLP
jgi:aminoglycoside phosphotransferase (APT) family kinase protein